MRILIVLTAKYGWDILKFDVKNALLHGELEDDVYMSIPPGYQLSNHPNIMCKLKKALDRLKQSPRAWFGRFTRAMKDSGYKQSIRDHTLFIKHANKGGMVFLIVYVDDILITQKDEGLAQKIDIKSLRTLKYFQESEVAYSKEGIFISQHKCILDLLKETGILDCRTASTLVDVNVKHGKGEESPIDKESFQRLIGQLIYLNNTRLAFQKKKNTRLDMSFAMSSLSQFMSEPHENHLQAVL